MKFQVSMCFWGALMLLGKKRNIFTEISIFTFKGHLF